MTDTLTQAQLKERLSYDPATGVFRWLVSPANNVRVGSVAGYIKSEGYRLIQIDGRLYRASRLAWLYMTGEWPAEEVDHDNLVRDDDRWSNLRKATRAQNAQNRAKPKNNTSGVKGVSWHTRTNKWRAQICVDGRCQYLGLFDDINTAGAAYAAAVKKRHGEFGRAV